MSGFNASNDGGARHRKNYTEYEIAYLKRAIAEGIDPQIIALKIDRKVSSISKFKSRWKMENPTEFNEYMMQYNPKVKIKKLQSEIDFDSNKVENGGKVSTVSKSTNSKPLDFDAIKSKIVDANLGKKLSPNKLIKFKLLHIELPNGTSVTLENGFINQSIFDNFFE